MIELINGLSHEGMRGANREAYQKIKSYLEPFHFCN